MTSSQVGDFTSFRAAGRAHNVSERIVRRQIAGAHELNATSRRSSHEEGQNPEAR